MRAPLSIAAAMLALVSLSHTTFAQVQPCPDPNNCVQVSVEGGSGKVNDTVTAKLTFKQGPSNADAGGTDEIAALALTLSIAPNGNGTPFTLADCTLDADGLPGAVKPDASLSNFKVVVENASCANGRTHCLCPDAGQTRDNFVNLVVYGPNPLPTPGPNPIDIPLLPSGPPPMVTIDLKIGAGVSGIIPLHVYNQAAEASPPQQYTALLSVGDKLAVDQTCVPVPGQPPCTAPGSVSQVAITDGSIEVAGTPCVGDCNGDGEVTVDELLTMVSIALGNAQVSQCLVGDANKDDQITVDEILTAVGNALNGCPQS
jgi:hypothetical protein